MCQSSICHFLWWVLHQDPFNFLALHRLPSVLPVITAFAEHHNISRLQVGSLTLNCFHTQQFSVEILLRHLCSFNYYISMITFQILTDVNIPPSYLTVSPERTFIEFPFVFYKQRHNKLPSYTYPRLLLLFSFALSVGTSQSSLNNHFSFLLSNIPLTFPVSIFISYS